MKEKKSATSLVLLLSIFFASFTFGFMSSPAPAQAAGSVSFLQFTGDSTALSTHTFSSQNLGTPAPDRYIFVIVHGEEKAGSVSSVTVTIGGVSAVTDVFENDPDNGDIAAIARARVPDGATGDIVVTTNDLTGIGIGVYRASGIGTPVLKQTTTDENAAINLSVNTSVRGVMFAGASIDDDTSAITTTGVTEDYDSAVGPSTDRSAGGFIFPTTGTTVAVSFDNLGSNAAGVAASYHTGALLTKPSNNLGLIGYWPFNEATSTIATDFSGNGRHGTLSGNAVTWVSGKRGSALNFGGTDDNVTLGQLSAISAQQKITVSAWIYDTAGTASKSIVSRYTAGVPSFVFYVSDPGDGGGDDMEFNPDGAEAGYTTGNVHQTNRWEHWVVVYDGSQADADKITFYLNGTAQAETLTSTPVGATTDSSTNVVRIGADSDQAADFTGKIDEVRIYSRALSASEVANLYRAGATRIGVSSATLAQGTTLASGLTGLWTLDGKDTLWTSATGGSVLDGSGNVRTLTMSGMSRASSPAIGKLGQALSFNGTGTSLTTVTNLSTFVSASEATMAVWVKPTGTPSGVQMVITDDTFEDVYIQRDDASNFSVANWDGSGYDTITVPYTNNEWIHLVLVHTGGTLYAYKNGIFVNSTASGDTTNLADPLVIGASGGAKYFNGTIDEIRTYNRGLTASEVKQLYLLGQGVIKQ